MTPTRLAARIQSIEKETHHDEVHVPISEQPDRLSIHVPRRDATDHEEVDGLEREPGEERPYQKLGERLDATGKVVRGKAKTVTDGPFVEVKDSIQGYMLVQAKDMEQALELAKGCPILDGGGTVEIRPFVSM